MISALILSIALAGQAPRVQFETRGADGQTYRVSGFWGTDGRLWYLPSENTHVPQVAPSRPDLPGMTTNLDGTLNGGVDLSHTEATGTLDTNDPALLDKLADCPNGGGGCRKPDPSPAPSPEIDRNTVILLAALCGAALILLPKRQDG